MLRGQFFGSGLNCFWIILVVTAVAAIWLYIICAAIVFVFYSDELLHIIFDCYLPIIISFVFFFVSSGSLLILILILKFLSIEYFII